MCFRSRQEAQDSENRGIIEGTNEAPAEDVFSPEVKGDILDFRPTSQQGKRENLSDPKDQREILWLIRKKRPKRVIGCGWCILLCKVLYHEHIRRGAWFLHDLSGDALQLSLPCMIRLECRHDVFHALGDARDWRDGGRVSFFINSAHILPDEWKDPNVVRVWSWRSARVFGNMLATEATHPPSCTWRVEHSPGRST